MPDSSHDIEVTGNSDGAVAAVSKATDSLQAMLAVHKDMKDKFSESFSHVGVYLFGRELLYTIGLGRETRVVLGTLNLAVNQASSAFGLAGTALAPWVFGLAALGAILYKVHEHFAKHHEDLTKIIQGYKSSSDTLEEYTSAGGKLSSVLQQLSRDIQQQTKDSLAKLIVDNQTKIAMEQEAILRAKGTEGMHSQMELLEGTVIETKKNVEAIKEHTDKLATLTANLEANKKGFATWEEYVKSGTKELEKLEKETEKQGKEVEKMQAAFANQSHHIEANIEKVTNKISTAFSGAFSRSLFAGQNLTEGFKSAFKNMAESIVSEVIQMVIEINILNATLAIYRALGGPPLNGLPGLGGGPMPDQSGFVASLPTWGGGQAVGGDYMVSTPTMFMAGEAGPERATFTPMGSSGGAGGSGSVTVNVVNNFNGVTDIRAISQQVGYEVTKAVKGLGQTIPTR